MAIEKESPQEPRISTGSSKDMETVSELYLTSLPQEVISTTEDRLRLALIEYMKKAEKKNSWLAPLGLVLTLTLSLMMNWFKNWGLPATTWQAIFIIGDAASFGWLVYAVTMAFRSMSIDEVIAELRKHSDSMIKFVKR